MGDVVKFQRIPLSVKAKAHTLCKSNRHKWVIDKAQRFDSQQGRLISHFRCSRCGKQKIKAL